MPVDTEGSLKAKNKQTEGPFSRVPKKPQWPVKSDNPARHKRAGAQTTVPSLVTDCFSRHFR